MAWMICGTVPDASFPLTGGRWRLDGGFLHAEGGGIAPLSVQRGTPALLGTALLTCETLGVEPPTALLAGDTGNGDGSRKLYSRLAASPSLSGVRGITFHYLFPDLDGHNRVLMALEEADPKPVLVADAGFMYVAKMSGYADAYDLFTPDAGELAFLADEKAPHPFYTRGFLLAADEDIPSLVERAYQHGNALEGASPPARPSGARNGPDERTAPSLRILTEKPPSSRLGAFFTRQPEPFQAIPMATTFPETPFRWISFAHPTNTKRPDRLSI